MKLFEYRAFRGVVTTRHHFHINIGRLTLAFAWLSEYVGPLRWFVWVGPYKGILGARWSRCLWIHRMAFGVSWDPIGLDSIGT